MELAGVGLDRPERRIERRRHDDVLADQRAQHRLELDDDPVQVEQLGLQHLLAAEREELPRQERRPVRRLPDLVEIVAELRALVGLLERQGRVAADRGQHVVEVVCDAAREPADRLELLALPELLAEQAPLGHVLGHGDRELRLGVRVANERDREERPHDVAGRGHEAHLLPVAVTLAAEDLRDHRAGLLAIVRMDRVAECRQHLARVAQQLLRRGVGGHDAPVEADQHRRHRGRLEHRTEPLLALAQERDGRQGAVREQERRDQHRYEPRVRLDEAGDRHPEDGDDEVDAEAQRREEAALAERVSAREQQHHREQHMVDGHEDGRRGDSGHREREVTLVDERLRNAPGAERAQHVVRDIEALQVPLAALLHPRRDVQEHGHSDDERRRQDERARDDEGRTGVEAVVPADADREERGERGEREEDREGDPVRARRRDGRHTGDGGGRDRGQGDGDAVDRGTRRQPAHAPGLPADLVCNRRNAHLPHQFTFNRTVTRNSG